MRIEDGLIAEISVGADAAAPPDGALDLAGRTLLPGLIDAHAHVSSDQSRSPGFGPPPARKGELPRPRELGYFILVKAASAMLAAGVTSVRDVGAYDDEAIVLREAVRLGIVEGPRILSCGRIISATAPGGAIFTTMYREADGPDDMRQAVREQLRRGADFVKLMATGARSVLVEDPEPAQMTADELHAIVDEAHRLGIRVAAHAEGLDGREGRRAAGRRHGRARAVAASRAGAAWTRWPTRDRAGSDAERRSTISPIASPRTSPSALVEQAKRQREEAYQTLVAARDAGVTLAMGHDSGPPGDNAIELVRMVDGGLSPLEGIVAATRGSAAALGLEDVGTVTAGAVADLLVVDGDPLADIRVLNRPENVWLVLQSGRIVGRERPRDNAAVIDDAPVCAPEFALAAVAGGSVSLTELVADGPALLVFVAEECPTSAMTLRRLAEPAKLLDRAGVTVAAVFEDPLEVAARTARRAGFAGTVLSRAQPVPGIGRLRAAERAHDGGGRRRRAGRSTRVVGWDRDGIGRRAGAGRSAGRRPAAVGHRRVAAAQAGLRRQEHVRPRHAARRSTAPGPATSSRRCSSAAGATGCR